MPITDDVVGDSVGDADTDKKKHLIRTGILP